MNVKNSSNKEKKDNQFKNYNFLGAHVADEFKYILLSESIHFINIKAVKHIFQINPAKESFLK